MREVDAEREKAAARYVRIRDLVDFLNRDRETLKRIVQERGFKVVSVRSPSGQMAEAITAEEAKLLIASAPPIVELVNPKDL